MGASRANARFTGHAAAAVLSVTFLSEGFKQRRVFCSSFAKICGEEERAQMNGKKITRVVLDVALTAMIIAEMFKNNKYIPFDE